MSASGGFAHRRANDWAPGQRIVIVFVNGDTVFPGTLQHLDPSERDVPHWFISWDNGDEFDYSFSQEDLLLLDHERNDLTGV